MEESPVPASLTFTDAAARKVGELIREEATRTSSAVSLAAAARDSVQGSPSMRASEEGDTEVANGGHAAMDPLSFQYWPVRGSITARTSKARSS